MPEYLAPGVYVEEVSFRPKSIEGVSTSTCAYVGPTRKGPLNDTPELLTSVGDFERLYGGVENLIFDTNPRFTNYLAHAVRAFFNNGGRRLYVARTFVPRVDGAGTVTSTGIAAVDVIAGARARFVARQPGSGGNGEVRVYEKTNRATTVTLNSAAAGSLLRVLSGSAGAAQPAAVEGGTPSFTLSDGDQLTLTLAGGDQSITFNGSNAEAQAQAAIPVNGAGDATLAADSSLSVTIDGAQQTIALPAGDSSPALLLETINTALRGGYARLAGGDTLVIGSDSAGSASVVVLNGPAEMGISAEVTANGSGNVTDLNAVSVAEIDALLSAAAIPVQASLRPGTGVLRLVTSDAGSAVTLAVADNATRVALGLPTGAVAGVDGSTASYYVKSGNAWLDASDTALDVSTISGTAEIISINVEAEDADGYSVPYEGLGFDSAHPQFIGQVLAQTPSSRGEALQNPYAFTQVSGVDAFELRNNLFGSDSSRTFALAGGNDGSAPVVTSTADGAADYESGLELLAQIDDIAIVAAPGHSALGSTSFQNVQSALISHCERLRYRFAVLDTPSAQVVSQARDVRSRMDTTYAALYYPWVTVANPLWRPGQETIPREINLPPSGFVTGIYARTDVNRGVWKAPANEVVRGALRFEQEITHGQQEVLNPEGVNCLRFFFGRGYRVWGARTASTDPEWEYVNVRRYFIYLEHSIDRSTQWAVFEPNGPRLWANIVDTISAFLFNEWRNGALFGSTPDEAFFVRCDRSTMTQADWDNGRLICEIGVSPLRPAEFVIFRIGQKTADAQ
jgi:phage tail sheath protein FI